MNISFQLERNNYNNYSINLYSVTFTIYFFLFILNLPFNISF